MIMSYGYEEVKMSVKKFKKMVRQGIKDIKKDIKKGAESQCI